MNSLQLKLTTLEKQNDKIENRLHTYNHDEGKSRQEKSDLQQENSRLRVEITNLKSEIAIKEAENSKLSSLINSKNLIIGNLEETVEVLTRDNNRNWQVKDKKKQISDPEKITRPLSYSNLAEEDVVDIVSSNESLDTRESETNITLISDSHARDLDAKKLYQQKIVSIHIPENKTIEGALAFLKKASLVGEHTLTLVGSNDLVYKSVADTISDLRQLVELHEAKFPDSNLHILPAIHRLHDKAYNAKVNQFNSEIYQFQSKHTSIMRNTEIHERNSDMYQSDCVHFLRAGTLALVNVIKSHLNPILGFLPYIPNKTSMRQNTNSIDRSRSRSRATLGRNHDNPSQGRIQYNNRPGNNTQGTLKRELLKLVESMEL